MSMGDQLHVWTIGKRAWVASVNGKLHPYVFSGMHAAKRYAEGAKL